MTLTISNGSVSKTVTVVPGTFRSEDRHVDAGGGVYPLIRTNLGRSGSCEVLLDTASFTAADAFTLISGTGEGAFTVSSPADCKNALLDVSIEGDGVQKAVITWNGVPDTSN